MSTFISMPFGCTTAQVPRGARNYVFCNRFVPVRYQFMWSLTPQPQPLISKIPRLVPKYRESRLASSVNVTNGLTKDQDLICTKFNMILMTCFFSQQILGNLITDLQTPFRHMYLYVYICIFFLYVRGFTSPLVVCTVYVSCTGKLHTPGQCTSHLFIW